MRKMIWNKMRLVVMGLAIGIVLGAVLSGRDAIAEEADPTRAAYLAIAKQGWVFDFRSSLLRRGPDLPPVLFNGKSIATGAICVFGAPAHPLVHRVLNRFQHLLSHVFGREAPITFARGGISACPPRQRVYLRLYERFASGGAFNADLRSIDAAFGIDLPKDRPEYVRSPAQGIGFFGRNGDVAHLLIRQPEMAEPTLLQQKFYRSILIEELFQVVSYGVDILKFDPDTPFLSKLQERPAYLKHLKWGSEAYMRGLLASNPKGMCAFDVFMLHALAQMTLESSNSEAFLEFIDAEFDDLLARTRTTLADPDLDILIDETCMRMPR